MSNKTNMILVNVYILHRHLFICKYMNIKILNAILQLIEREWFLLKQTAYFDGLHSCGRSALSGLYTILLYTGNYGSIH